MKFSIFCLVMLILCTANYSSASRILFLFPSPSKSHLIVVQGLSTTLAEQRGHDVTVVSPFPLDKPMKNYRDIKLTVPQDMTELSKEMTTAPDVNIWTRFPRLLRNLFVMGNSMIKSPQFEKMMAEEKFDLVVIGMFFNDYLLGIGDHFKCPTIMLSVGGAMTMTNILVGNPLSVEAVRHKFLSTDVITFTDRVKNFMMHGIDFIMMAYLNRAQKLNYDYNFPSDRYISLDEARKNISLILLNSHFSQGEVRPFVPALIEVGGLQIKPTVDRLPEKIQDWLDGASKDGAVLFSLGSNAKTNFLQREKIDILLKVFSKLKQRVVMKWETDELEGKPENVLISKWLPQDGVLAHKNLKLFISHCGLGSVAESKYHGVPIVGMPIGIDQNTNVDSIVGEGWAEKVDFSNLNENELEHAIRTVLDTPKYAATAKSFSELYRDRPMNARDTAAYWTEYVIRHRGAKHLRYPGADLNFWQYNSVDVVLFLLAIIYITFRITCMAFKFLCSKICRSRASPEKKTTLVKKKNQ